MVLQNYKKIVEMTTNMIYFVALGVGLKCPSKILLNTQCLGFVRFLYLHTFYVLFQTSFTIKSGVTDVAWKRFDIFMFDFNVFFEIAKTWGFIPAYMTNMKFTFFGMRVFFVLFQTLYKFITCWFSQIHFLCFSRR